MNNLRTAILPVYSDFLEESKQTKIITKLKNELNKFSETIIESSDILNVQKIFYLVLTGGTEAKILKLQKQRVKRFGDEKIVLLAYESNNSLAASLELLARFKQIGKTGKIVYLPDAGKIKRSSVKIRSITKNNSLSGSRIGEIGKPSDWLVASSHSAKIVNQTWGAEVVSIDIKELKTLYSEVSEVDCKNYFEDLGNNSEDIIEPSRQDMLNNIKVYLAMKMLIAKYELTAVTLRCFDLVLDFGTTGCFALSRLNDDGIIAGCEGDIVSTIGMLIAFKKTGKLPWMANPSRIDIKNNSLILAHCTVPISLVENYLIRSHFESGIGVGIQGTFPRQAVTLFRLGGNKLNKLWQAKGKIIKSLQKPDLCRTQIKIKLDPHFNVSDLLYEPLGNHLIIAPDFELRQ